ncbi:MAG: ribosome maturation factor RimP [Elusimicrobiota bacterium]
MSQVLLDVENLLTPVLTQASVELVDLTYQKEHGGWTLRFYLDKPGGITLDDCSKWNHEIGELLEQTNLIDRAYVLEVCSPGLNRPLRKWQDYVKFKGQKVHIKLLAPINGQKNFHGIIQDANEANVRMITDDQKDVTLPRSQIDRANLKPEIKF